MNGDDGLLPADAKRLLAALVVAAQKAMPTGASSQVEVANRLASAMSTAKSVDDIAESFCQFFAPSAQSACQKDVRGMVLLLSRWTVDATTLEQSFAAAKELASACSLPVCRTIEKVAGGAEEAEDVCRDIQSRNYGAAAGEVFDALQQRKCPEQEMLSSPPLGCREIDGKVYDFLRALAVYSIDSATSGNPGASNDADFRKAAVDLIEAAGGAGVRRSLWARAHGLYVPEFALRDAWRPGHLGTGTSPNMVYPSLELVRGRLRVPVRQSLYLGLHVSVLDLLGPFVEVSTRNANLRNDEHATRVFLLGFIVPRLDIEVGVPQLTKNLVVGFGGAFRFFRAESLDGGMIYCTVGDNCSSGGRRAPASDYFEFSVFAKFVP